MTKRVVLLLGIAVVALAGCVDTPDGQEPATQRLVLPDGSEHQLPADYDVVVIDTTRDALEARVRPLHLLASVKGLDGVMDIRPTPPSGPCTCDGPACIDAWVNEHLGCGVCAVFVCGGGHVHGCSVCE